MAMQQIVEMLGVNTFFFSTQSAHADKPVVAQVSTETELFPCMKETWEGKKKMMEEGIWSSCVYCFSCYKGKNFPLLCSLVWMWHFTLFPFYSFLSSFKGYGYLSWVFPWQAISCAEGCQHRQATAALSSGLHPCSPTRYWMTSWELLLIAVTVE